MLARCQEQNIWLPTDLYFYWSGGLTKTLQRAVHAILNSIRWIDFGLESVMKFKNVRKILDNRASTADYTYAPNKRIHY